MKSRRPSASTSRSKPSSALTTRRQPTATGVTGDLLLQQLETRLDNVATASAFALSRRQARQVVRHGHVQVNGRKVNIPSASSARSAMRSPSARTPRKLVHCWSRADFASGQNRPDLDRARSREA